MHRQLYRTTTPVTLQPAPAGWTPEQGPPPPECRHDFAAGPLAAGEMLRFNVVEHATMPQGMGAYTRTPRGPVFAMVVESPHTPNGVLVNVSGAEATYSLAVEAVSA